MKQGDIFVSSWGYDQTNVDFYEVVKVAAKTVTLIPIERKVQLKGFMRYTAMPIPGSGKGKAFRRRIIDCFDVPACRITSYATARLWDGKAREGSSYACVRPFREAGRPLLWTGTAKMITLRQ